ncbi:hypothetical protein HAX54_047143 [Datura stramonium]|uniref:Uncharacterized protein n=1 Tax=Datura stramonium TaxID=4076 RepID=A0ABS8WHX2_DATST|nr:hypothetical protein [Datura stramonium]
MKLSSPEMEEEWSAEEAYFYSCLFGELLIFIFTVHRKIYSSTSHIPMVGGSFLVQLQHHARHRLPTFQLIFVHVIESLVFVPPPSEEINGTVNEFRNVRPSHMLRHLRTNTYHTRAGPNGLSTSEGCTASLADNF